MKKKFLILTLCFTLVFTSINYKKVNALDLVISPTMLATVSSLAVAYGLTIKDNDNLYNLGKEFVTWCGDSLSNTIDTFNKSVYLTATGVVVVGKTFLDIFDSFVQDKSDFIVKDSNIDTNFTLTLGLPSYNYNNANYFIDSGIMPHTVDTFEGFTSDGLIFYINGNRFTISSYFFASWDFLGFYMLDSRINGVWRNPSTGAYNHFYFGLPSQLGYADYVSSPGVFNGTYDDTNVNSNKNEDGSIGLVIPGDLGGLVGSGSNDVVYDGTNSLPFDGVISVPGVNNPSIGLDGSISFPMDNVGDVPDVDNPSIPNDTPFANITEYIIGLVVPSDSYWTDTFGGLHNNFINAFPMVDMNGFNSLVVDGKPFPNIDVKIMGSQGRVVNGDTVNSIVEWLRPIIAGFVFLCLMFFNYRKLYKLIRNSEPFEGIGKVENHAN